jgi:hypothetical protein
MFISHKNNVIQSVRETKWECRRKVKGLNKSEYWAWEATVTSGDPPVVDYSGETDYTIVECTDENVQDRLKQLGDYTSMDGVYNIKYYASKRDAEEIKDNEGNSHDPKQYVQSHFVGQDDTRDARLLAEEWKRIRTERTRLLTECDYYGNSDVTMPAAWKTYRKKLRDLPADQSDKTKYSDITWPTKPA